jgi:hypothetical protein
MYTIWMKYCYLFGKLLRKLLMGDSKMAARAGAENLHFTLNRETRRAPKADSGQCPLAWEDADQVSFAVPWYSHRQAWDRAA